MIFSERFSSGAGCCCVVDCAVAVALISGIRARPNASGQVLIDEPYNQAEEVLNPKTSARFIAFFRGRRVWLHIMMPCGRRPLPCALFETSPKEDLEMQIVVNEETGGRHSLSMALPPGQ